MSTCSLGAVYFTILKESLKETKNCLQGYRGSFSVDSQLSTTSQLTKVIFDASRRKRLMPFMWELNRIGVFSLV